MSREMYKMQEAILMREVKAVSYTHLADGYAGGTFYVSGALRRQLRG